MLAGERGLLDQRGRRRAPGAHAARVPADLHEPPDERRPPCRRASTTASGRSAGQGRARGSSRGGREPGASRPAAAWSPRRSARRARPTAARARTRCRARSRSASCRCRRRSPRTPASASPNGTATSAAHPSRAIGVAPSVRCSCQRVVRISAASGTASSTSGWMRRVPDTSRPGSSTIAVSNVPTACRNVSVTRLASTPTDPRIEFSRRDQRQHQPGGEHDAGRHRRGDRGGDDPGQREPLADDPGELRRLRVHPPEPPRGGGDPAARVVGRPRGPVGGRRGRLVVGAVRGAGSASAGGGGGPPAAQPLVGGGGAGATRNSSRRAPQAEQNRARALSRSPQFGQKLVSATRSPVASVAPYGYHLRPMEAACGS